MIELRKSQLDGIFEILNPIKLNRINDASVRKTILKLLLAIQREQKKLSEDVESCRQKFFSEFEPKDLQEFQDEFNALLAKIRGGNPVDENAFIAKYPTLYKAYLNFNEAISILQAESASFEVEQISLDAFVDDMVNQDINITAKEINILQPLFVDCI